MIVSLVGLRGAGKTTVAAALGARLNVAWLDLDAEIERRAGRSVAEILTREGEPAFRDLESAALQAAVERQIGVLATGGGVVLRDENRRRLSMAGPVVWLQADPATLRARLAAHPELLAARPSLTSAGTLDELEQLAVAREPLYRSCATLTIRTDDRDDQEIVEEIMQRLDLDAGHREGKT